MRRPDRLFRPCLELLERRDSPSVSPVAVATPQGVDAHWLDLHRRYSATAQQTSANVVFFGDSITEFWRRPDAFGVWQHDFASTQALNFGIRGDSAENVLWRVTHGEMGTLTPKVVVLLIGTNDTKTESASAIAGKVEQIIGAIQVQSPATKVLLLGLLPRGEEADSPLRDKIAATNRLLAQQDDGDSVRYLDAGHAFLGADGKVSDALMPDYLHPDAAGYTLLGQAIAPLLHAMLTEGEQAAAPTTTALESSPATPTAFDLRALATFHGNGETSRRDDRPTVFLLPVETMEATATPADAENTDRSLDTPLYHAAPEADDPLEVLAEPEKQAPAEMPPEATLPNLVVEATPTVEVWSATDESPVVV